MSNSESVQTGSGSRILPTGIIKASCLPEMFLFPCDCKCHSLGHLARVPTSLPDPQTRPVWGYGGWVGHLAPRCTPPHCPPPRSRRDLPRQDPEQDMDWTYPPPTPLNRITDTGENITSPHTTVRGR